MVSTASGGCSLWHTNCWVGCWHCCKPLAPRGIRQLTGHCSLSTVRPRLLLPIAVLSVPRFLCFSFLSKHNFHHECPPGVYHRRATTREPFKSTTEGGLRFPPLFCFLGLQLLCWPFVRKGDVPRTDPVVLARSGVFQVHPGIAALLWGCCGTARRWATTREPFKATTGKRR